MYLKEVECTNYRSYGYGAVFRFQNGLNMILGGNNSGKSNIIKALDLIFSKLLNLTQIRTSSFLVDEDNQVKYELQEALNISEDEYHNKNPGLLLKLRLTLNLGDKDRQYLGELRNLLKDTPHGRRQPTKKIDEIFDGKINEVDFVFEIVTDDNKRMQKSVMKLRFDKDPKETKLNITDYLTDKFFFGKFTSLLKECMIIFPEFRSKPISRQTSNIVSCPSGENLSVVLYNLKNGRDRNSQQKFREIERRFKELFDMEIHVSEGNILEFVKTDGTVITTDGIGGGLIEILNILTHIIFEENKIIIMDEPESHLHPQGRRLLKQILTECSKRNQMIIISHSVELFDFDDLDRITLVRQKENGSEPYAVKSNALQGSYLKNILTKLRRAEYKELFFAKKVLLVEGETEFGAFPIFAAKLNYDFDKNSTTVIPVHGNYFVAFARILHDLQIPHLIVCDADVLMDITKSVNFGPQRVKTSSIFSQLNWLEPLLPSDQNVLYRFSDFVSRAISAKWTRSQEYHVFQELKSRPGIPIDINNKVEKIFLGHQRETYDEAKRPEIEKFLSELMKRYHISIRVLESDFEGIFQTDSFSGLLESLKDQYGQDKVLMGTYLASEIPPPDIPKVIREIIDELKSA